MKHCIAFLFIILSLSVIGQQDRATLVFPSGHGFNFNRLVNSLDFNADQSFLFTRVPLVGKSKLKVRMDQLANFPEIWLKSIKTALK